MTENKTLEVQQKKELQEKEEKTIPGRFYVPYTDIYETEQALVVVMEIPGVDKKDIDIKLEKNEISIEGRVDFNKYENFKPTYTEYNVGHFSRSFRLSSEIDQSAIDANVADGVLTLNLPKVPEAAPRAIQIN
ncbi:MAG: Hsp20/alpha crystallin family protein [Gammaproteobacteria bacterium]|nr:Hsp20/alpha crystallin family protein [Gammaproteobacteria bacterium]